MNRSVLMWHGPSHLRLKIRKMSHYPIAPFSHCFVNKKNSKTSFLPSSEHCSDVIGYRRSKQSSRVEISDHFKEGSIFKALARQALVGGVILQTGRSRNEDR